ncbi:MAG: hypothetical protein SNJ53_06105 [Thermodesulfovibrionales bacterium]
MTQRRGEKIGWISGWIGAFVWVFVLSIIMFYHGQIAKALLGFILIFIAIPVIFYFAPWRFPQTKYLNLMIPPYIMLFIAFAWAVFSYGEFKRYGLDWWSMLWLLPSLIPLGLLSSKKWESH